MRREPHMVVHQAYGDYSARKHAKWNSEGVFLGILIMIAGGLIIYWGELWGLLVIIFGFLFFYFSYKAMKKAEENIGVGNRITYG